MRPLFGFTAALTLSGSALATQIVFTGGGTSAASGMPLAASASFDVSGNNLVITLTNTSTGDVLQQPDILTAVFFNVRGPVLGLSSAAGSVVLASGSTVLFGGTDPGGVVGGEFGYREGISGALSAATGGTITENYGVSSSGFGVFGGATFPGSDLDPPPALDGINYGLTSQGDNPATGQSAVTGDRPLIKNSVVITLVGLPSGFDPSASISSCFFQYGTALEAVNDDGLRGLPAPGTFAVLGLGGLLISRRRR
jgi:hypothetical protein